MKFNKKKKKLDNKCVTQPQNCNLNFKINIYVDKKFYYSETRFRSRRKK